MTMLDWQWIPKEAIGTFFFEKVIQLSSLPFDFKKVSVDDDTSSWDTYEIIDDKTRFSVENEILTSVECSSEFIYRNKNLINMPTEEAIALIDETFVIVDMWDGGKEYSCDELGIIIWDERGKVESISVSI